MPPEGFKSNILSETEQQLVASYVGGLKESIQKKLEMNPLWSLLQAINLTYKIEMQQVLQSKTLFNK